MTGRRFSDRCDLLDKIASCPRGQPVASFLGQSQSGWSRVETGDTTMIVSQLRKAARFLGVEPHEIMRAADEVYATLEGRT